MVKTIVILVLLFNGDLVKEPLLLPSSVSVHDCFNYARMHIDSITTHSYDDPRGQGLYLNDGRGTVQGFICE
jgi:hypothetical protein